jgi:outer membrane biosynthesis protein TonB
MMGPQSRAYPGQPEVTTVLDLGASERTDLAEHPAEQLLTELAEQAGRDGPWARALAEIRRRAAAGEMPVGLYRLSEVLAPHAAPVPAQRVAAEEAGEVVEVVRRYPCAVLDAPSVASIAENLAAVLGDGKRVLVTGADPATLRAVRAALPASLHGLCLDAPLPLSNAELRELRWLLVTATPSTRARLDQALPDPNLVPSPDEVAALCRAAGGRGYPPRDGVDLLPELLGGLEPGRLAALLSTARRCQHTLAAIDPKGTLRWPRPLLERVLFGAAREEFDLLLRRTTDVVLAADRLREAGDQMAVVGALPAGAVEQLREYVGYLEAGGRARTYFRSPQQRAVQPVLRHLRLNGLSVKDPVVLRQALTFVELVQALDEIDEQCRRLRIPEPRNVPDVAELNRWLDRVEEAARAAEHLRHEVLFIHPSSPVPVPDLDTIEQVATAIARSGGEAAMADARGRLSGLADRLERAVPPTQAAPEVRAVVEALRAVNLPAYLDALGQLAAASREQADERRRVDLLGRLGAAAPGLAASWEQEGPRRFTMGTARFVPLPELLERLPAADTVDLVMLLGAGSLGVSNLLVAAAAPRLLAVDAGFAGSPPPFGAVAAHAADSVLAALRCAGVPVVVAAGAVGVPDAEPVTAASPPSPVPRAHAEVSAPPPGVTEVPPPPVAPTERDERVERAEPAKPVERTEPVPAPFPVPAQREAPAREADPTRARRASGPGRPSSAGAAAGQAPRPRTASGSEATSGAEPANGAETEFVVMPLGIVARPVNRANRATDDQHTGA